MAEWQTRTVQVRVLERVWGFKSPLAHHIKRLPLTYQRGGAFFVVSGAVAGFLSSADDPSRLGCAVDEGAGAYGTTVAAVNPLCPRLTPAATAHPCPVE